MVPSTEKTINISMTIIENFTTSYSGREDELAFIEFSSFLSSISDFSLLS
jgi:hypothetical protein